jgi:serine/threonine protein kinase
MQPLEPEDPRSLGEYRLLGRLGAGGMGRVYLARSGSGRTVAVKVVHPHFAVDEQFRRRFRREVASARRVGGDWTAPVLDADPDGPTPWVATGYVAGPSLAQAVAEHGPLPETAVRALGAGLCEALRHVHGLGLVHRDVKPSNVLLTLDGPRLIDFGIARAMWGSRTESGGGAASLTSTGVSVGSPGYMSPEQVLGEDVTGASDVFALGAVLAYAATGESPFPGDSSAALLYHVVHGEARLDGVPDGLRGIVTRALAKAPAGRPDPAELVSALAGPAGATGLVRSGWLPGPIVEQVSRQAVKLLELEPEEPEGSGPVPFTTPSYGPDALPSDALLSDALRPDAGDKSIPPRPEEPPRQPRDVGPLDPPGGGRTGIVVRREHSGAHPEGEPGQGGRRGRRVSCTLVVSFACVVAAALLGTYFLVLPGTGGSQDNSAEPPAHTGEPGDSGSGGGGSDQSHTATPGPATVPEGLVGRWKGDLYSRSGTSAGTLTVTIEQGRTGDTVVTGSFERRGKECPSRWKLVSADDTGFKADASGAAAPAKGCPKGGTKEEFTLRKHDRLRYESHAGSGADASGTLRKIG